MATLLARIQVHPGREQDFESVMRFMYRETHDTETGVLRYEYWRGQIPGFYYCLLAFPDNLAFWHHQASDHHEGQMQNFQECIAELELEVIDPVSGACPLPQTSEKDLPLEASSAVKEQALMFPVAVAAWWESLRAD